MQLMVEVMGTDCTNGGATSGKAHAFLVLTGEPEPQREDLPLALRFPYLFLRPRRRSQIPMAVPVGTDKDEYPMFGGHFIYTSDSRFPFEHPIPVHDRYEA